MGKAKWFALCCALPLCMAAGIGIGLVLPHALQSRDGSKFFRQLLADTGPGDSGRTTDGTLAVRLRKIFTVAVVRSGPETQGGDNGRSLYFDVVIISRSLRPPGATAALLSELEDYLKELAKNTKADKFATNYFEKDGKKVGFSFRYEVQPGHWAEVEALLYENEAGSLGRDGVIMNVREMSN